MSVTALTLQVLCLDDLTTGLVFKLTILAEKLETEAADEDPSSVVPDTTLTLDTLSLSQWTAAGVGLETFLTVANPGLAKVANGSNHLHLLPRPTAPAPAATIN